MRTDEERLLLLHKRAQKLEDKKMSKIWGTVSACLLVMLVSAIVQVDIPFQSINSSGFAGASLLGESAGAYVLVAVVSFVVAVGITLICIRKRKK